MVRYYKVRLRLKEIESKKTIDINRYIPLNSYRTQYFPSEIKYKAFFIYKSIEEAFNIFIKLSPSIISTLSKADRRITEFGNEIDNPLVTVDMLRNEINEIDIILTEFVSVSYRMLEKMNECGIDKINEDNYNINEVDSKLIQAYMSAVNTFKDLSDTHSSLNSTIHNKLLDKYPDLVEPFRSATDKVVYILFINLVSYSNKLDENIFVYN